MRQKFPSLVKILFEQDKKDDESKKTKSKAKKELMSILKKDYPEFVQGLIALQNDEEFLSLIRDGSGGAEDSLSVQTETIPVKDLFPMQNIIGLDDSLKFKLKDPKDVKDLAAGGSFGPSIYDYAGRSIITCGKKYIVDGHHRWSTVYMLNPDSIVEVQNITNVPNGQDALKISQIVIAALKPGIEMTPAKGINIFKSEDASTKKWILDLMSDNFAKDFSEGAGIENDKDAVADKIVENINILKTNNSPAKTGQGANKNPRTIMPQYDDAGKFFSQAQSGKVNLDVALNALGSSPSEETTTKESISSRDAVILERWNRLAGLIKD